MARLKPERLKQLEKYTKAEIIEAIGRNFSAGYIVEDLLNDLELQHMKKLLDDEREADRIHTEKMNAVLAWRNEMCKKYGNGEHVNMSALPLEEIKRGMKIEQEYLAATATVEKIEKRIKKAMEAKQ